jgi:hypothetical protein
MSDFLASDLQLHLHRFGSGSGLSDSGEEAVELQLLQLSLARLYLPLPLLIVRHRRCLRHLPSLLSVPHLISLSSFGEESRQQKRMGGLGDLIFL